MIALANKRNDGDKDNPPTCKNEDATGVESPPTYQAEALTKGGALAQIVLNGQVYRLRITRAGKLILTK